LSEYIVIFEQAEDGGWGAYLPDLPGVVALGDSRPEVEARIREGAAGRRRRDAVARQGTARAGSRGWHRARLNIAEGLWVELPPSTLSSTMISTNQFKNVR
jgi:hypothetical protein